MKHWEVHYIADVKGSDNLIFGCRPRVAAPDERTAERALELQIRKQYDYLESVRVTFIIEVTE